MGEPYDLHFSRKDWDLDFRAELYKEEFFGTDAWTKQRDDMVLPWVESTRDELKKLLWLKEHERPEHLGEIIREQQAPVMISYWYPLLKFAPARRPATTELLYASIYLAGSVATYSKSRFNRARPWVLEPRLSPPIPPPGLLAYPGGHATQMHLMAKLLADLAGVDLKGSLIERRADEVAKNRERAGVNYPSDTDAGRTLADRIFDILRDNCPEFGSMLMQAKQAEWNTA